MATHSKMKLTGPRQFHIRNEITLLLGHDPEGTRVMQRTLEAVGFPVVTADTCEQAAELVDCFDGAIRLLIIDIALSGESAREVIATLCRSNPALKVLVASREVTARERHEIQLAGVIELIRKPVDREQLLQVVRRILEN